MIVDKAVIEKELKTVISGELKRIRKQNGSTLEQMANEIGIEYNNLYNIYTGQNLPRLTTLVMINQAFGIPSDFWFKSFEKMTDRQNEELHKKLREGEILKIFYKLDDDARNTLLKILRSYNRKPTREIK